MTSYDKRIYVAVTVQPAQTNLNIFCCKGFALARLPPCNGDKFANQGINGSVLASDIWGSNPNLTIVAKIAKTIQVFSKLNIECTRATRPFFTECVSYHL